MGNPAQARKARESLSQLAKEKQEEADSARQAARYVSREPYVPQIYDYGLEIGSAWGAMNYYSVGFNIGYHLGRCVFTNSQTCQQYLDLLANVNGRDSHTHYLGLASVRWQYVNFPSPWSPMFRLMTGINSQIIPGELRQYFTYGAGIGMTTYLHPRADIRLEYRVFNSERVYSQFLFIIQFKMEKWVEFFAEKLKDIGLGTASVTSTVIKGTVDVTGTVLETSGNVVGGVVKEAGDVTGIKKKEDSEKTQDKKTDHPDRSKESQNSD